ncbi:MAG: ABC transporter substrate-binding protein [Collinsella sp.]
MQSWAARTSPPTSCRSSFKAEDDVADGEKAVNAFNSLADWGMQVLVGPTTTGCSLAVAQEAENAHLFMLTPSATARMSRTARPVVFRCVLQRPCDWRPTPPNGSPQMLPE